MYMDSQAMRGDTTVEDARSPPICVCFVTRGGTELKITGTRHIMRYQFRA